ncbi:MAG: hypothetical protein AB2814_06055 [Candidatus Sedimenticola endophacoides]
MLNHLLALLGLSLLCALWVLFQRWLLRREPGRGEAYRPGCGACANKGCAEREGGGAPQRAPAAAGGGCAPTARAASPDDRPPSGS